MENEKYKILRAEIVSRIFAAVSMDRSAEGEWAHEYAEAWADRILVRSQLVGDAPKPITPTPDPVRRPLTKGEK